MATDKKKLLKGIKFQLVTLPLLIIAPILITIGFKAIKLNNNYLWLITGIIIAIAAIIVGFLGIRIILDAFFNSQRE